MHYVLNGTEQHLLLSRRLTTQWKCIVQIFVQKRSTCCLPTKISPTSWERLLKMIQQFSTEANDILTCRSYVSIWIFYIAPIFGKEAIKNKQNPTKSGQTKRKNRYKKTNKNPQIKNNKNIITATVQIFHTYFLSLKFRSGKHNS